MRLAHTTLSNTTFPCISHKSIVFGASSFDGSANTESVHDQGCPAVAFCLLLSNQNQAVYLLIRLRLELDSSIAMDCWMCVGETMLVVRVCGIVLLRVVPLSPFLLQVCPIRPVFWALSFWSSLLIKKKRMKFLKHKKGDCSVLCVRMASKKKQEKKGTELIFNKEFNFNCNPPIKKTIRSLIV